METTNDTIRNRIHAFRLVCKNHITSFPKDVIFSFERSSKVGDAKYFRLTLRWVSRESARPEEKEFLFRTTPSFLNAVDCAMRIHFGTICPSRHLAVSEEMKGTKSALQL